MKLFFNVLAAALTAGGFTGCDLSTPKTAPPTITLNDPQFRGEEEPPRKQTDYYAQNDNAPTDPAAYETFKKVALYYRKLVEEETAALRLQSDGYYNRLSDNNLKVKPLPPEDVAVEEAHFRLWQGAHFLKEAYSNLNREQKAQAAKEIPPLPLHLGVGGDGKELLQVASGPSELDQTIRGMFMEPDYIAAFSLSEKRQQELVAEVERAVKEL